MRLSLLLLLLSSLSIPATAQTGEWKQLFDGKDLTGWKHVGPGNMTVEKETVNYSGQRTDFYLKHIFRSVEQVQRPLITVDEIRRIKPPTKASNDPDSKITAPGDMLIFINGVAPIYGVQSLYFLNDALLARTKLKPPVFKTAAQPHTQPARSRQTALDITSIVATAIDQQAIEEKLNGNS